MTDPETRPSQQATAARRPSLPVALIAGVAALLVVAVFISYRIGAGSSEDGARVTSTDSEDAGSGQGTAPGPTPSTAPTTAGPGAAPGTMPPAQGPGRRGLLHVAPVQVEIPAIGVSSELVDLGLNPDGTLQVPTDFALAGWYTDGPFPGDAGGPPALIVGHVDNQEGPAVFYELDQLEVGDEIRVARTDGSTAVFVVYEAKQYPKSTLPTQEIYREREASEIVLITCTGDFDANQRSYLDNYVVTARLDPELSGVEA